MKKNQTREERRRERRKKSRELSSKRMKLARYLERNTRLNKSGALSLAHFNYRLKYLLSKGKVLFSYRKKDGSLRDAWGTLCEGVSVGYDDALELARYKQEQAATQDDGQAGKKERKHSDIETTFTYWDIGEGGYRSWKAENLVSIVKVEININKFFC